MKTGILFIFFIALGIPYTYAQQMESTEFITKNPERIFVGAIMEANSINNDDYKFIDAPLNPITISYSLPVEGPSQKISPSYENMMKEIRETIKANKLPKPSLRLTSSMNELQSYSDLSSLFGQNINTNHYFGATKKTKKTLVALFISQLMFSVDMNYFENSCSDEKVLARGDELIVIGSVYFGRQALVLVESDYDSQEVKIAMNEWISGTQAQSTEKISKSEAIIANSTIRIMLPGNETIEMTDASNPLPDVLAYINRGFSADDFGQPVKFSAMHLKSKGVFVNKYTRSTLPATVNANVNKDVLKK